MDVFRVRARRYRTAVQYKESMAGAAAGGKKKRPADEPAKDWEKTLGPVRKLATVLREVGHDDDAQCMPCCSAQPSHHSGQLLFMYSLAAETRSALQMLVPLPPRQSC